MTLPASASATDAGVQGAQRPRIAVLFHRLGPYHHARLAAAARGADIVTVEFSEADRTYAWDKVPRASTFDHVTLFHDKEIDEQRLPRVLMRVARVLRRLRPDVVAIPGWSSRGALAALAWCRLSGTPAIVMSASTHRDHTRTASKEFVKRSILRMCAGALAGGQAQVDYLVALGMAREQIRVGYDVVDNDHFALGAEHARTEAPALRQRLGLPSRFFLASSRLIPKKNLGRLLQAYAAYRSGSADPWSLVLVGDGPDAGPLRSQVADMALDGAVFMPGFKQYDALPEFYGLAGAFILASTSEQWGLVVNEAMAAGLPVLVSRNCGCVQDLVEDGVNGYAFDPEDVAGLAALMDQMASADCDRAAMGAASRAIVGRWSPARFADGLIEAAQVALSRPLRGTPALQRS